jgi:hypothetical protein
MGFAARDYLTLADNFLLYYYYHTARFTFIFYKYNVPAFLQCILGNLAMEAVAFLL